VLWNGRMVFLWCDCDICIACIYAYFIVSSPYLLVFGDDCVHSDAMMQQHEASMQRQEESMEHQQLVMQQMDVARLAYGAA